MEETPAFQKEAANHLGPERDPMEPAGAAVDWIVLLPRFYSREVCFSELPRGKRSNKIRRAS